MTPQFPRRAALLIAAPPDPVLPESDDRGPSRQSTAEHPLEAEIRGDRLTASKLLVRIARLRLREQENRCRPSVMLRPQLLAEYHEPSESMIYAAAYGPLICTGETPDAAFQCFDEAWCKGI